MASILVVDDDAAVRNVLLNILKKLGHEVHDAADGAAALAICLETRPDLTFLDMYMPGQDGIETIRALRREIPGVKVIAMSGEQLGLSVDVLHMASLLGAVGILRKPFELDEVREVVAKALGEEEAGS